MARIALIRAPAALALWALAALAAGCGPTGAGDRTALRPVERARVARVVDGDTLLLVGGRRVRLVQIDAPELETDCYGRQARAALLRLAPPGRRVALERDPALDDVDRYGRLLRYVLAGGRDVNLELVAAGAAEPFFYGGGRGRVASRLLRDARRARAERRGLWGACPAARLSPRTGAETGPASW